MFLRARSVIFITATLCLFFGSLAPARASAPTEMPVIIPGEPPARKPKPATCTVRGKLHCSEYGSRYRDPLLVVFVDGDGDRYRGEVSEKDGSFETAVPPGSSCRVMIEFQNKDIEVGAYDAPKECKQDPAPAIDIYHPGSMLELIWEVRDGGYANVDFKTKSE